MVASSEVGVKRSMKDRRGEKYGFLTIVEFVKKDGAAYIWTCKCECGSLYDYQLSRLLAGGVKRCRDCRYRKSPNRTHGQSGTATYKTWQRYKDQMCTAWRDDFEVFYDHMGLKLKGYFLCRYDLSRPHSPHNSYWGQRQQRPGRSVLLDGGWAKKSLAQWGEELGITRQAVWHRIKCGWTPAEATKIPKLGNP